MRKVLDHNKCIAIIGAGASGLTAAYHLKKLGYQNVTIFEKENRVGGKVHSYNYDGYNHELGQLWVGADYKTTLEMANELGIKYQPEDLSFYLLGEGGERSDYEKHIWKHYSKIDLFRSLVNYWRIGHIFNSLKLGGYHKAHPDLFLTFDQFAKKHGIEPLAHSFLPFWVGCGYGPFAEVPTLYVVHLFTSAVEACYKGIFKRSAFQNLMVHPKGHQYLWEKMAASLDVRLKTPVDKIVRSSRDEVIIESCGEIHRYDAVIISAIPSALLDIIDTTDEERDLFSRVDYFNYCVTLFKGEGCPTSKNCLFFYTDHDEAGTCDSPVTIFSRKEFSGMWIAYQMANEGSSQSDMLDALKSSLPRTGIDFKELIIHEKWKYFPHVKTADLQDGFYERLHALQGERNTYYIGGLMNFETVECTASFAKQLVDNHFG